MPDKRTFIIVGGGLAGAKAVEALRGNDFDGLIILFSAEEHLPYERPPLSKDFLGGTKKLDDFTVDTAAWYRDHDVDLRLGTSVDAVDPAGRTVTLPDGSTTAYDKLLLATGSRSRRIPLPGADATGVHYLRTIDDAAALDGALSAGSSLAIVGAGWIGLEVAASARQRDVKVTVVETAPLPLLAALGSEAAQVFADLHREHGVDLRLQTEVAAVATDNGTARGLTLGDGTEVAADAVLIAVGAQPNIELAQHAGLAIGDGGVVVDAGLRTSDPDIYAVGDIAAAYHPLLHTRIRTEHWANALKQPAVAAAGMLGTATEYSELP
jgi:3-phenylpropionate/trans-cinnamate dioxygenase ferredoxin reductase subunit